MASSREYLSVRLCTERLLHQVAEPMVATETRVLGMARRPKTCLQDIVREVHVTHQHLPGACLPAPRPHWRASAARTLSMTTRHCQAHCHEEFNRMFPFRSYGVTVSNMRHGAGFATQARSLGNPSQLYFGPIHGASTITASLRRSFASCRSLFAGRNSCSSAA